MTNGKDKHSTPNWDGFGGYSSPNFTPVPDQLFDEQLAYLSGGELKVLLYIIRRTFGFKKESDNISLSQMLNGIERRDGTVLDRGVGLSKKTLLQALKDLQVKNLIFAARRQSQERGNEPTCYSLHMASGDHGVKTTLPLGEKLHQGDGGEITPSPRGKNSPIQETGLQETAMQDMSLSKIRKATTDQSVTQSTKTSSTRAAKRARLGEQSLAESQALAPTTPQDRLQATPGALDEVRAITKENGPSGTTLRAQKRYSDERQVILTYIQDFARELGDEAPLPSSVSRAYNLWMVSGIPIEAFTTLLHEARSRTWDATAGIEKLRQPRDGDASAIYGRSKNRMAYYFGILTELVERHTPKIGQQSPDHQPTSGQVSAGDRGTAPLPRKRRPQQRGTRAPQATESSVAGVSSVGDVLASRKGNGPLNGHIKPLDDRETLQSYIERLGREFGDEAPLMSSVTRAQHLYERTGVPMARFLAYLFEARALTEEYSANVTKKHGSKRSAFGAEKNRMAYFFGVLEHRLGLAE